MRLVVRHLRRQIAEIEADPALRAYGGALALLHVLTAAWARLRGVEAFLGAEIDPICWPLLPDCHVLRVLTSSQIGVAFTIYGAAGVVVAALFLGKRRTTAAYLGLLALNVIKLALVLLDFRMRRNQHYMGFAVSAAFLFVPAKRDSLRLLVMLFYFWAGTLKLNREWLTGGGLYAPLWFFRGTGVIVACAYVVVLELAVSWGLLLRSRWLFWAAFTQFIVFHVFSWPVVSFFYPLLMFAILTIYPLCRLLPPGEPAAGVLARLLRRQARPAVYATAAVFSLLQLVPHLYPGDTTLTGEGRLFALHMFDARAVCQPAATLKLPDGSRNALDLSRLAEVRTACDPAVLYAYARNLCRKRDAGRLGFVDLDVTLASRRATDPDFRPVVAVENFCARKLSYRVLGHNDWIRTD